MVKALLSLLIAIFALSLVVASVFASFTTSVTNGQQVFETGYIDIKNTSGTWEQSWYNDNLSPGNTLSYLITVSNTGNIPIVLLNTSHVNFSGNLAAKLTSTLSPVGGWGKTILPSQTQDIKVHTSLDVSSDYDLINQQSTITVQIDAENATQ